MCVAVVMCTPAIYTFKAKISNYTPAVYNTSLSFAGDAVMCYNSPNCTGPNTVTVNPKECCVGTDESVSYSDKENCGQCVGE